MTMANGTATAEKKLQFKPRKTSTEQLPDAPEGEWEALIPRGGCKVVKTQNDDPRVLIPLKLEKAADEANESFQGSVVQLSAIIFDDDDAEKRRAANMSKSRLRALCEACDVDFGEVYPTEVSSADDFKPLFDAVEGKRLTIWTKHNTYKNKANEMVTDTEVRFRAPGSGTLESKDADENDDDRPSRTKTKASSKKK